MISEKMRGYVENSSAIRAMFEEGKKMADQFGAENVYDFSLGNPNVPAPAEVKNAIEEILKNEDARMVHGYMNNAGYEDVREAVATSLNQRFGTAFHKENILMTVGAAGGMNVLMKTLLNPGDEVMTFAPYFGEYRAYVTNYDGILKEVEPEAIRKGKEDAAKKLIKVDLDENASIPHDYTGKFGGASVLLKRAPEGTGIIAGGPARNVLEIAGIKNIRTKSLGSNNKQNVVLATLEALKQMKSPEEVARLRGKSVEEILG